MSEDDLYAKLKAIATAHALAFSSTSGPTGSPFEPDNVYKYRTPDCVMRFHPEASLPPPFNDPVTRTEHGPGILMLGALIEKVHWDIHDMVVDVKARTVATKLTANYTYKAIREGPKTAEAQSAYVWITEFDETGEKIVGMEEWLDPERTPYMLGRAAKYAEENE